MREGTQERDDPVPIRGVEIGERLIDEQQDRALHDGGGDRDERRLARRQSAQPPVEEGTDADGLGHLVDPGRDDHPRDPAEFQGEPDLVADTLAANASRGCCRTTPTRCAVSRGGTAMRA